MYICSTKQIQIVALQHRLWILSSLFYVILKKEPSLLYTIFTCDYIELIKLKHQSISASFLWKVFMQISWYTENCDVRLCGYQVFSKDLTGNKPSSHNSTITLICIMSLVHMTDLMACCILPTMHYEVMKCHLLVSHLVAYVKHRPEKPER